MPFFADGARMLHYETEGPGNAAQTLVFVNSLGTDLRIWDGVRARLRRARPGLRMIAYDKRGHGLSDLGASGTHADHVGDLQALLAAEARGAVIVCGLSVGGQIALGLAASGGKLAGLVLSDTAHRIGTAESWQARIDAVRGQGIAAIADVILERWFSGQFRASRPAELAGYRNMLVRTDAESYARTCAAIRDTDLTEAARALDLPVLCVVGSEDGATPPALVAEMAALIPGASLETVAGAGHLPCIEDPERMAALIGGHLARIEAASGDLSRHALGMATRRAVLGDAHVDRAEAAKTAFDEPFQTLITEAAWGHVWSRPDLTRRERSIVTLALLAALGQWDEVAMHTRATRNTGASEEDIREAMLHVAIYAGVPAANHALKLVKSVLAEMKEETHA